ncbi:hypothetical protein [Flavihumibacter fluvii]|uniref:hypothetical protein n=1 Tax=Flavihumibacter fluvii TaxID=2838157 RepID=UPI001BDE37F9|nr:hypothetical protein [Flavihumibacter fluvii]ULQ53415.1 hypothetical protein KJS93_03665 [Flavihumibacter fluvii]
MTGTASINSTTIQEWIANKFDTDKVRDELSAMGFDEADIASHLKEFNRIKNSRKQFIGFICLGVGAFLGFISCVLSLTNPIPELFNVVLYGLTSIAILVICAGLYFVFE